LKLRGKIVSDENIKEKLKNVGLNENILKSGLGKISIGQRQRILVAFSTLNDPDVLLFDEPTADIDIAGQESIYKMLHQLQKSFDFTVILVSHDLNVVYRYADKVLCLNKKNICLGTPKEIFNTEQLLNLYGGEKGFYAHKHQ